MPASESAAGAPACANTLSVNDGYTTDASFRLSAFARRMTGPAMLSSHPVFLAGGTTGTTGVGDTAAVSVPDALLSGLHPMMRKIRERLATKRGQCGDMNGNL